MDTCERACSAQSIRECLSYLLPDAVEADLPLVCLHLRIAIMEADDVVNELAPATLQMCEESKSSTSGQYPC